MVCVEYPHYSIFCTGPTSWNQAQTSYVSFYILCIHPGVQHTQIEGNTLVEEVQERVTYFYPGAETLCL